MFEAAAGSEALSLASTPSTRIDLLVTDLVMPGLSGRELVRLIAPARPGLLVLYVSGFPEDHLADASLAAPGVAFLPKPYSAETLARAVRAILDGAA